MPSSAPMSPRPKRACHIPSEQLKRRTQAYREVPALMSAYANLPGASSVALSAMTEPLCLVGHMFDRVSFAIPNGASNNLNAFPACAIVVQGAAASVTATVRVEITLNVELVPYFGNNIAANGSTVVQHDDDQMAEVSRRLQPGRSGTLAEVTRLLPDPKKRKRATPVRSTYYPSKRVAAPRLASQPSSKRPYANSMWKKKTIAPRRKRKFTARW